MRVLVTGAEGFVGKRVVARLRSLGHDVLGGVLLSKPADDEVLFDITDPQAMSEVYREFRPEGVVHLAALSDVAASWKELPDYFQVNVVGVENVVRLAPRGCLVVFASSAEVYGRVPAAELPAAETRRLAPASPYAMSKASAERLALIEGAIAVRSYNLVGAGQSTRFALPAFAAQLSRVARGLAEPVLRVGNLETRRDFLHVDDGADGYALLVEKGERGAAYNLASGVAVRLSDALAELISISGLEVRLELDPERLRPADVPVSFGDTKKLQALGWRQTRRFREALEDLWGSVSGS